MKKKAFTLIELIAVLVILAILALIVTPLVMNIIRKARISADKRSIDAYGRSVELAIANYLLDNGDFPTDISQLTIEYSGDRVECSTTQLNSDSSIYLAGCTVSGRSVDGYTYGSDKSPTYQAYEVGDEVTYNNVDYYVIENSGSKKSTVTLLKAEPLSVAEVNQYGGLGTQDNHVNVLVEVDDNYEPVLNGASNQNGYGGVAYYSSATCSYPVGQNSIEVLTGCTTNYLESDIKYIVDSWSHDQVPGEIIEARLLTIDDLIDNLGYEYYEEISSNGYRKTNSTPNWIYNNSYPQWTMSSYKDYQNQVWSVQNDGSLSYAYIYYTTSYGGGSGGVVRPVITLKKSAINN